MHATVEIFLNGVWRRAGVFAEGCFQYDHEYVIRELGGSPVRRAGLEYPVTFELHRSRRTPGFLRDLLPTGAGLRSWLRRLDLQEGEGAEWSLLLHAAGSAPGNLRIAEAVAPRPVMVGFTAADVVGRTADFLEHAESCGAMGAGATDLKGEWPKLLLVRDQGRRWYADGALDDREVLDCWVVKYPAGRDAADLAVLRNEGPYLEVARRFGLRVGPPLEMQGEALLGLRLDRSVNGGGLERHGFETLSSVAASGSHSAAVRAVSRHASNPRAEVIEYLRRDILATALRHTENHLGKSAFLKRASGTVELSPLYDFAPTFLDPRGVPRCTRWDGHLEPVAGRPDWGKVAATLTAWVNADELGALLLQDAEEVERLPEMMWESGVEDVVIEGVVRRCSEIAGDLRAAELKGA